MRKPVVPWVFEIGGTVAWVALAAVFAVRAWRKREFPVAGLIFLAATTMFWQEWFGDWAGYLLYNPRFKLMPWHRSVWTTPNKPWAVVSAYGWYFAAIFPALLAIISVVRRARPQWGRLPTLLAVSVPVFWAFDIMIEGVASRLSWWTYTKPTGPAIHSARGNYPFLYPTLVFVFFGVVMTWVLDQRDQTGRHRFEVLLGVTKLKEGWKRETARVGAWVATMNVLYWALLIFPIVLVRQIGGGASSVVP